MSSSTIEVAESEVVKMEKGNKYFMRLYWCIGVIVEGKKLIHIFPIDYIHNRETKMNYLLRMLWSIEKEDSVVIVTSENRNKIYKELISLEDVLKMVRLKTDNVRVYDEEESYKIVIATTEGFEVRPRKKGDMKGIGAGVMISSIPIKYIEP